MYYYSIKAMTYQLQKEWMGQKMSSDMLKRNTYSLAGSLLLDQRKAVERQGDELTNCNVTVNHIRNKNTFIMLSCYCSVVPNILNESWVTMKGTSFLDDIFSSASLILKLDQLGTTAVAYRIE